MKKWVKAKIKWLSAEDGGRRIPMAVDIKYCPIIEFINSMENECSWSADIFIQSQTSKYESIAKISFLSEDAPFELLQEHAEFKLYESSKLVATGVICSS